MGIKRLLEVCECEGFWQRHATIQDIASDGSLSLRHSWMPRYLFTNICHPTPALCPILISLQNIFPF
jgi:hypothetical protein